MTITPATHRDHRGYQVIHPSGTSLFYPSVGAILDILLGSSIGWIDQADLDEGTRCHEEMKLRLEQRGTRPEGLWLKSDNPRVQALLDYLQANNFIPLEAEQPRYSSLWGYAGTPDALLQRGGLYVVPDWKFSNAVAERYHYQVDAYIPFYDLKPKPTAMIFQVTRECKVKPFVVRPSAIRRAEFLAALTVMKKRLR